MGTRGLRIVRFRSRYFLYWNQYDSYPQVLGEKLVNQIPADPEQYKSWLEKERSVYAEMTVILETKVLIVTEEKISADLKRGASAVTGDFQSGVYSAMSATLQPYHVLDDRLEELPSVFCGQGIDFLVEWMYVFDLDREIFSVSSRTEQIQFRLDKIPAGWTQVFEEILEEENNIANGDKKDHDSKISQGNNESREKNEHVNEKENDPKKTVGDVSFQFEPYFISKFPKHEYFWAADSHGEGENKDFAKKRSILENSADNKSHEYRTQYQSYHCSILQAKRQIDKLSKNTNNQILAVVMFERLISSLHLESYIHSWSHKDSAFRELAFAILSFAAGQYRFDELQHLEGQESYGYFLDRTGDCTELLPVFGSGCHKPGEEAGSAPKDSIYWFENVLVSLVPDNVLQDDTEAGIAKVVEFGLETGARDFYAVVFSLLNMVMLHVTVEDGVTAVNRTSISEIITLKEDFSKKGENLEIAYERRAGFISLIHFFNAAVERYVAPFNQGCLPAEIYSKIIAYVEDDITYKACAKVSKLFRSINPGKITFGKALKVIEPRLGLHNRERKWIFHFLDREDEGVIEVEPLAESRQAVRGGGYWSPTIGMRRPSIVSGVKIWFGTRQESVKEERRGWSHGMHWGPFSSIAFKVEVIWKLPEDVTAKQVQEIWAYYLQHFLSLCRGILEIAAIPVMWRFSDFGALELQQRSKLKFYREWFSFDRDCRDFQNSPAKGYGSGQESQLYTNPYTFPCTLMQHYHEFSISRFNGSLWVCTRRPRDGRTFQQRAETLAYVKSRFQNLIRVDSFPELRDGDPVIIAFGLEMTLYYWRQGSGVDDKGDLEPDIHLDDYSKEEVRLEMETKVLTPLMKEWQD